MRYVMYSRVSTQKQGESGLGLESQIEVMQSYIYNNKGVCVKSFVDIASGKSTHNRVELERAIQYCVANGYTLIVSKLDRLARNTEQGLSILRRLNGNFVACNLPSTNEMVITMFFAIATEELKQISSRTKLSLRALKIRKISESYDIQKLPPKKLEELIKKTKINGRSKGCDMSKAINNSLATRRAKVKNEDSKYLDYALSLKNNGYTQKQIATELTKHSKIIGCNRIFYPTTVARLFKRALS